MNRREASWLLPLFASSFKKVNRTRPLRRIWLVFTSYTGNKQNRAHILKFTTRVRSSSWTLVLFLLWFVLGHAHVNCKSTPNENTSRLPQSEMEALIYFISDHFGDGQRWRGRRTRGVAAVQDPLSDLSGSDVEDEVIHQVSVHIQCLSAHPGRTTESDGTS